MCGIVCAFNLKQPMELLRPKVLQMSKKLDIVDLIGVVFIQAVMLLLPTKDSL